MSYRVFILLFLSFSPFAVCKYFQVQTFLQYSINECNSVTVICQHDADQPRGIRARLQNGKNMVCDMFRADNECAFSSEGNQFRFTMKNFTAEPNKLYHCMLYTMDAPVVTKEGVKFLLIPGFNNTCPKISYLPDIEPDGFFSIFFNPLILALAVTVLVMCGYGVIISIFYFRLKRSSEDAPITYVPMQRKVRGNDNAEYMDMRKVQRQAGTIRDLNHNSPEIRGNLAL